MSNIRIGDLLLSEKLITQQQLDEAVAYQKTSGGKHRLGQIFLEKGLVDETQMLDVLAKQFNTKRVIISRLPIDIQAVSKIPKSVAQKYNLMACYETEGVLFVALSDPLDLYAIEDVKAIVKMPVTLLLATKDDIQKAIGYWYSEIDARQAAISANSTVAGVEAMQVEDLTDSPDDSPVVALVNSLLYKAQNAGASDIHIEPFDEQTVVRIRVDGQILELLTISSALHNSVITRIKILSSLDIAEKRVPQDGHFRAKMRDMELNVRVSVLPTIYGEKAVLRFLSRNVSLDHSETFGMDKQNYEKISSILRRPHGIIYITGPTGSGKTTTLYMILERLAQGQVNISTIEDPVERNLPRINQTQTNDLAGLTFESGLRSLLRQDPDIIMVGETRDKQTASIAVSAALTGHLVLSTLHTNDAVSAVVRLADMDIEPYMIANSLTGVVAQRLVKKICPFCKVSHTPSDSELSALGVHADTLYKGEGCPHCNGTGYKGRIAIHEVFAMDTAIRNMISRKEPAEHIYEYLDKDPTYKTLRRSAQELVLAGVTTVDEMLRLVSAV